MSSAAALGCARGRLLKPLVCFTFMATGVHFSSLEVMAGIHLISCSVQGRRVVSRGLLLPAPAMEVHRLGCPCCTSWGCPALNRKSQNCLAFLPTYSSCSLTSKLSPPNTDVVYTALSKGSAPSISCLFNLQKKSTVGAFPLSLIWF